MTDPTRISDDQHNNAPAVLTKYEALEVAIWRLEDMLKADDGQAWKEAEKALPRLREALLFQSQEPAVPEGFELVAVKGFSELMYWLERCENKGHLENCPDLVEPWAAFEYRNVATPAPAPAQEPETALQKFTRFKVAETEGNPVEMLRAFCAFAMNSQDWFDVEPFFDLVREAMASRTAVAPAQEVGLTDEEIDRVVLEAVGFEGYGCQAMNKADMREISHAVIAAIRAKGGK